MTNDFIRFDKDYNGKIDFRFLKQSNPKSNKGFLLFDQYQVFLGKKEAENDSEIYISRAKKAFENLVEKGINKDTLMECADIFKISVIADRIGKIASEIGDDCKGIKGAIDAFYAISLNPSFGPYTNSMAIIAFNAAMKRDSVLPIIFYRFEKGYLFDLVRGDLSKDSFEDLLKGKYQVSVRYNTKHAPIAKEQIKEKILNAKADLANIGIVHLDLTGSLVNGTFGDYSDADVIVDFKDGFSIKKLKEAKSFIGKLLGLRADVISSTDRFAQTPDLIRFRERLF